MTGLKKLLNTMGLFNMEVIKIKNFSLAQTLECGQCFHFNKIEEDHYVFVFKKKAYDIKQDGENLYLLNLSVKEFEENLWDYFDLETDYEKIKEYLKNKDERLKPSIEEMKGIKILKQEFFETMISFIISANNQIPRIKKSVALISERYGDFIEELYGIKFYAFPDCEQLSKATEEQLRELGVGFRDKYIIEATRQVLKNQISEIALREAGDEEALKELTKIKGIGTKVASCIILFALSKMRAFPIDVWIKRIMQNTYFDGEETKNSIILEKARECFSPYEGYAQQYLFHYGRTRKNV